MVIVGKYPALTSLRSNGISAMQALPICPRCHFRLPPGGHICRTCGYVLSAKKGAQVDEAATAKNRDKRGWNNLFHVDSTKDTRHDDTALGET